VFKEEIKNITIAIPSKEYDKNLNNCIYHIRKSYKKVEIFLLLDKKINNIFDKKIKIFFFNNKNIGYKRNFAAKKSKKKFICFIDSDAYPKKNWLENYLKTIKLKKDLTVIGGPNISPNSNNVEKKIVSKVRKLPFVTLNSFVKSKTISCYTDFLPACNLFVNKKEFLRLGGMDEKVVAGEEIKFFYNLNKFKKKIYFIDSASVFHKDRNFKNFLSQRMTYGTEANLLLLYPCKQTLLFVFSLLPLLNLICLFIFLLFQEHYLFKLNLYLFLIIFFLCILFTFKIYNKSSFIKNFICILISIYGPGLGFFLQFFISSKAQKNNYKQE
jgi:GT2 family glycosyltransferase